MADLVADHPAACPLLRSTLNPCKLAICGKTESLEVRDFLANNCGQNFRNSNNNKILLKL
ncbi:MAG TPA: hypothetical protein VIJ01_00330 [Candidatus Angelobacter sp.]